MGCQTGGAADCGAPAGRAGLSAFGVESEESVYRKENEEREGSSEEERIPLIPSDSPLGERGPEGPKSEPYFPKVRVRMIRGPEDDFLGFRKVMRELVAGYSDPVVQTALTGCD